MKIKVKPFKTWQQQIEILNEYGNNFLHKNPGDLSDVLDYLMTNGFQVGVDALAPLLWKNFNDGISKVDLKFINEFKFNDLVELFNFDNCLQSIINKLLQNLERRLRNGIIYHTLKKINLICNHYIDFPFLLVDDKWSEIIGASLFNNKLSNQSFINHDSKFKFEEYYSFLAKYIEPFDFANLFVKGANVKKFYFQKVLDNHEMLESEGNFQQYKYILSNDEEKKIIPLQLEDSANHQISCTFINFYQWCKKTKFINQRLKNNEVLVEKNAIDGMINVLAKSFIPLYKSFTQEAFGDMIKFFLKLNENTQLEIIKENFPIFYQTVINLIQNKDNQNLILIGSFISLLNLFRNLRNKIAHLDIIYNFWDVYTPNNSSASKSVPIKGNEFWMTNKPTCDFFNSLLLNTNNDFKSDYFKNEFSNKKTIDYLNRINNLRIKVYCKYKNQKINFVNKSNEPNLWHLPIFFLRDAIDWLIIFTKSKMNFREIINQCFSTININDKEIINRLHDYLFNKIIISLEKIEDKKD